MLFLQHILCLAIFVQAPPSFEAASVKPSPPNSRARAVTRGGPGTSDPSRISFTNVTLKNLLLRAYGLKVYQIDGPDWLASRTYDIVATIPPETTGEQFLLMLQNLVTARFHVALHRETRAIQGYELIAGKGGPKLKPSSETTAEPNLPEAPPKIDANGFPQLDRPNLVMMEGVKGKAVVSFLTARAQPIGALAGFISKEFRMPILDKTGLSGNFDFHVEFAPEAPGAIAPPSDDSAPNLLTAIQQLGLKLNPRKVPVEVLIIDHADQAPAEN